MVIVKGTARILLVIVTAFLLSALFFASADANGSLEIWDGTVAEEFAGGDGTAENPFLISNGSELALLMQKINSTTSESKQTTSGEYYKLCADIYLNDISDYDMWDDENAPKNVWTPGGGVFNYTRVGFAGCFDGGNYDVKGIYINTKNQYNGLFGYVFNGDVKNLGITHSYINGGQFSAGIAGYVAATKRTVTFSGLSVSDSEITTTNYGGGIIGYLEAYCKRAVIEKCSSDATVLAKYNNAGGVIGFLAPYGITYGYGANKDYIVRIYDCVNYGKISGLTGVGGILGSSHDIVSSAFEYPEDDPRYVPPEEQPRIGIVLERCVNTGIVSASSMLGSVAGVLGPYDRDDKFIDIDLVGCYGTTNGNLNLYGIVRSVFTMEDSSLIGESALSEKETFAGFDFDKLWGITSNLPALRKLGDALGIGKLSAKGVFATIGAILGTGSEEIEMANVDFNGDGSLSLSDLNSYMQYIKGKGAENAINPDSIGIVLESSSKGNDYIITLFDSTGTIHNDIISDIPYSIGEIITFDDRMTYGKASIGNAYLKGGILDVGDVLASNAGYALVESYDSEGMVLTLSGSDEEYVLSESTKVVFSEKSKSSVREVPHGTLASGSKSYRQDSNPDNPIRVLLCTKNNNQVIFAVIVRD